MSMPKSQVAILMDAKSIFSRKSPDKPQHQPRTGGGLVVMRGGVRYAVRKGKLVRML
jgi:hypothetical protein